MTRTERVAVAVGLVAIAAVFLPNEAKVALLDTLAKGMKKMLPPPAEVWIDIDVSDLREGPHCA